MAETFLRKAWMKNNQWLYLCIHVKQTFFKGVPDIDERRVGEWFLAFLRAVDSCVPLCFRYKNDLMYSSQSSKRRRPDSSSSASLFLLPVPHRYRYSSKNFLFVIIGRAVCYLGAEHIIRLSEERYSFAQLPWFYSANSVKWSRIPLLVNYLMFQSARPVGSRQLYLDL